MPPERSNWIGLVCWGLIIDGMYGIYSTMKGMAPVTKHTIGEAPALAAYPISPDLAHIIIFSGYTLMVICGACMYERQGWARYVYLVGVLPLIALRWMTLDMIHERELLHPATVPHHDWQKYLLFLQMILYAVSAFILFMRRARRYYHPPLYVDE